MVYDLNNLEGSVPIAVERDKGLERDITVNRRPLLIEGS